MGEAKRRKNLGISPRQKTEDINLLKLIKIRFNKKLELHYTNIQLSRFFFMDLQY